MKIASSENLPKKVTAAVDSDDLGVFSYIAFVDRFKLELTSRWEKLEEEAYSLIVSAPVAEKHKPFQRFFENAEALVATTIHEYFQRLLNIATHRRQHLGGEPPLDWTKSHVVEEVCNFLGIESCILKEACDFSGIDGNFINEKFDWTSRPRNDSRILRTTERITGAYWLQDGGGKRVSAPALD